MKVGCPHCGAGFEVSDDRAGAAGATVTCPECLESCPVTAEQDAFADSGEFDLGFDLDGVMSHAGGTDSAIAPDAAIPTDPGASSRSELSDFSFADSGSGEESTGFGFEDPQEQTGEVSHLHDVDLTMVGTYHRTGRKLHHATDVVWTGKRGGSGAAEAPQPSPRATRPPPTPERSHADVVTSAEPEPSLTGEGYSRLEASVMGDASFGDFESLPPSAPPGGRSSIPGAARKADPRAEPSLSEPEDFGSVAGTANSGNLEEMDFSSLLEDSLSAKSVFGQDSNPFVDVGITSDSVAGDSIADLSMFEEDQKPLAQKPAPTSESGLYESSEDTNTFFVEAPSVSAPGDASPADADSEPPADALEISGAFDVDMPSQSGGGPSDAAKPPPKKPAGPRPGARKRGGGQRSSVVALALLLVVVGVGVGAEALGYGWFFMNLVDGESNNPRPAELAGEPPTRPEPPVGRRNNPAAPAPAAASPQGGLADSPQSYDQRMGELRKIIAEAEKAPDDADQQADAADATDELLRLQLRYRYRWPGRFGRDEARKKELTELMGAANQVSFKVQFWDLLTRQPAEGETREDLLRKAELALAQIDPRTLDPGRELLYKALLFREQGKLDNALTVLELALSEAPEEPWTLYTKALILHDQKGQDEAKLDQAAAVLDELTRVAPEHRDGQMLAARVAIARQTPDAYDKGAQIAEQVLTSAQKNEDAYGEYEANVLRAVVFGLQGALDERLEALEAAAAFDPRDEALILELAENDLKSGNTDAAIERLQSCAEGVCGSLRYYKTHIKVLTSADELADAELLAQKGEDAYPDSPDLLFWSGRVLEQRGKLQLAAKKYAAVRDKDPKYLEAYLRLAGIHRHEKQHDEAIKVLDEASKVFEGAGTESEAALAVLQERGELLVMQGRLDQAREVFKKIVNAQPTNAVARLSLAKLLTQLGYPGEAVNHFEKLYEQGKSGPEINVTFAEALIRSGKPDRAIEELKAFLEHNPRDLEALVKLGHAYVQKQRYEEAMAVLEHAVDINRNYAAAYYYAGLAELGRQRQKAEEVERRTRRGEVVREDEKPDFRKAIVALTSAKDKDPENLEYRRVLAEALVESQQKRYLLAALEQYDTVISAYQKAERKGRSIQKSAEVFYNRGLLASKLGRPRAEVLRDFQEALVLDSERADYIARYAEELYRMQSKTKVDDRYVLEAKAYFDLVLDQHNSNHARSNFYMGKISLREWDQQQSKRPGDKLHNEAYEFFQRVVKYNGQEEFPEALMHMGNILRDRQTYRLANEYYQKYLTTYRRVNRRPAPNERYVRGLMRAGP